MKKLLCIFILSLFLTGCTHKIYVALLPNYQTELSSENVLKGLSPALSFLKGDFSDKRSDVSKLLTFKISVHTYDFFAERPVEEAIFDGLATLFKNAGQNWLDSGKGNVKVNLQLLSVTGQWNQGMINLEAKSSMQIKLDFMDSADNLIYTQIYNGSDERKQAMFSSMELMRKSIDGSLLSCINGVAVDKTLLSALKKIK